MLVEIIMICDLCNSKETKVVDYLHKDYKIKDKTFTYIAKRRICSKCNALIYGKE